MFKRITQAVRAQATARLIYVEVAALLLVGLAALPGGFDYLHFFHPLASGCETCTYNPYFTEWFMRPFGVIGWRESYLIFNGISIAAVYWAARQLGGRPLVALLSPTFIWVLWLGQIDALPALGLAIAWWSLQHRRYVLVGLGLLLLATKPQLGGFAIIALAIWAGPRALIVPAVAAAASFAIYGIDWPARWLAFTPETVFAGDAWFYISAVWMLVGLFGVVLIRGRLNQLQYIIAVTTAGAPYLGAYSLFVLPLFRLRWWEIVAGYLPFVAIGLTGDYFWLGLLLAQPILIAGRLLYTEGRSPRTLR